MWLLTHTGELTHGKRFWLRPGTSHLLGRTRRDKSTFTFYIEDVKTISRKHLIIEVRDVAPGTAAQPEWRTEVALRDESKFGTMLDGESFNNSERVIGGCGDTKSVHEIRLGKWDVAWRLEWHPVVVTPSGLGKKKGDPVALLQKRLEPFDIKVVPQYVPGQTTHVVSVKRNTPRTLQALVEGRFMVSEAFLEALESKAKKLDAVVDAEGNEEVPRAPLEEDFDGNWPSEMEFVPPAGTEPVPRPPEMLAPNPGREAVFAGYTFVFSDSNQFDQLAPVVTQGNGKALLRELEAGSDNTEGFIRYVKNVAGENDMGEFEDGSEGKGVVVVRLTEPRGKKDEWWQRFYNTVDLGLGQRSINQNEFLDTIVTADASPLRQPLQEEEAISSSIPPPPPYTPVDPSQTSVMPSREEYTQVAESQMPPPSTAHEAPPSSEPPVPKTTRRGFRRALTASRFKGFDDFKPEELPKYIWDDDGEMQDTAVSQAEPTQASMAQSHLPAASQSQARVTRGTKRQQQAIEISDDEDNKLFPAASAMKRRKVEQQLQDPAMEDIAEVQDSPRKPKKTSLVLPSDVRKAKQEKDIDVLQVARERREKAEEERRLDEESLKEALEGMDLEEMKKLAKVEVMEIRPRSNVPDNAEGENGEEERWKPEWNGRKNFKKFRKRRPGEKDGESQAPLRGRKVIVTLQEVKHIDYNIDDEFFVDNERPFTEDSILDNWRKRDNARRAQRRAERKARDADSDLDDGSFRRTGRQMARNSLQQQRSNDIRGGPAKAIALHPEDDAEMQDFDPEEIAGQPRSEAIAAMTAAASSFRPGTASSTRSRASVSVAGGGTARGSRPSPAPSSQTLQGDGATQHQRPGSRASATSSTTATTTATRGKRGAMAPPPAEPPTKKKRKGKEAPPAKLGRGLGGDSGESGGSGDELKFRRRRR